MIAIDTNVLLRYLLQDDETQSKIASQLIRDAQQVLITDVVLVETLWTLKGKKYQLAREQISDVIHALFAEARFIFENSQIVWCALRDFIQVEAVKVNGKNKFADFSDALIANKAMSMQSSNSGLYTFDIAAQQLPHCLSPTNSA